KFYETPAPGAPGAGAVNFGKYVAVGGGIEAGYADGAIYTESQNNAYPNLIAEKIKEVNAALAWAQPDINSVEGWQFNTSAKNVNHKYGRFVFLQPSCSSVNLIRDTTAGQSSIQGFSGSASAVTNLGI